MTGVNELVLEVADLAAAEEFYAGVLGFPIVGRRDDDRIWLMAGDRTRIGLWTPQTGIAGGRGGSHVHYAMHVGDGDYEAVRERLRSHGLEIREEDFRDEGTGRALYVDDPDGNVVEFWTWDVAGHLRAHT